MTIDRERELVEQYAQAWADLADLKKRKAAAQNTVDRLRYEIVELLTSEEKTATAKYDDLGYIGLTKPKVRVNQDKTQQESLFEFLETSNRADLIKPTVNSSSLATFVTELLEAGDPVPMCIPYVLQPDVKLYKAK